METVFLILIVIVVLIVFIPVVRYLLVYLQQRNKTSISVHSAQVTASSPVKIF